MRHGNHCSAFFENTDSLFRAHEFSGFIGKSIFAKIGTEGFLAVFHNAFTAEQVRKVRPPYNAAPCKLGYGIVADIEAQAAQSIRYTHIADEPFATHLGKGIF